LIKYLIHEGRAIAQDVFLNRRIIFELTRREFKILYGNKYLGFIWALLEPVAMMLIMVLVFTYLRNRAMDDYPFPVYLLSGVIGFDFFNKSLTRATQSIKSYAYIVRRGHFRMSLLPLVNIVFNFQTHLIILIISACIFAFLGVYPSWYWLQLPYYFFASSMLLIGITWITSSLVVFILDIQYIINILMRTLFFLTPIFWQISMFPKKFAIILKLNPMYHIVEGYRSCFLYHKPFWSDMYSFTAFWIFTLAMLLIGGYVFRRLRPHFDDVL